MEEMLKEFVVEALDLAMNVEEHLLSLERQPDDAATLNALFRSFHTIKGGAGFMNLPAMVAACHLTENLFDGLRTGKVPVTPLAIEAALQASGFVADQLQALSNGAEPASLPAMPEALKELLNQAIEGKAEATPVPDTMAAAQVPAAQSAQEAMATEAVAQADDGPDWEALYYAVVPAELAPPRPAPVAAAAASAPIDPTAAVPAAALPKPSAAPEGKQASAKDESIRIDAVKLDALLEVAGESVQAANQASVLLEKLMQFKFDSAAANLMVTLAETLGRASRYSTELQRATLSTRMQPVGRLFQKFPRMVRELARDLGKEVELLIEGAETEVDRVVVDSLYDPLVHMLRNSLDHGIESADARVAAGKPAKAVISLKAWQQANSVMIQVADDGKGMDAQVLRNKALAKGLITESAAQTVEDALQLVFLPGFSTKDVASSVSGRGVGMDVVKTAVEKHRGTITIDSTLGAGTCFSIRLPIELSIVPTMLVRTAGAALAIPMSVVERVVQLPEHFDAVGGAPVMRDQGRPLPVRSLGKTLGYEASEERIGIVIAAPQPYILAVDRVEGTAEMVIKPLTAMSVTGITGTARSAEGELVLVLDLSFLLDGCRATARLAA
ncbi:chemotaxis protein CheA [Noviherbaspirillum sedimenti]|nr:chemotaxis protein CheA [Noviherbaspirillum sedimenti]